MNHNIYLLVPLLLPLLTTAALWLPLAKPFRHGLLTATLALETVYVILAFQLTGSCTLLTVGPMAVTLGSDYLSRLFSVLIAALLWAGGLGKGESSYSPLQKTLCLLMLSAMLGLCYSANLFTFVLFALLLTILMIVEPRHDYTGWRPRLLPVIAVAAMAAIALGALLFALYAPSSAFHNGGVLSTSARLIPQLRWAATLLGMGFFAWMTLIPPAAFYRARPRLSMVASLLPFVGALGLLRVLYYLFGTRFFMGSNVRTLLLMLALVAIVSGGVSACLTKSIELRLCLLSTCQSGSVVLGLLMLKQASLWGAVLQCCVQAASIHCLLICAACFRRDAGRTQLHQLRGIGRQTPPVWISFSAAALALAGLPPFAGFNALTFLTQGGRQAASPWNLLSGASILAAVLTAACLLPTVWRGFFPGRKFLDDARIRTDYHLTLAVLCIVLGLLWAGLYPAPLLELIRSAAVSVI